MFRKSAVFIIPSILMMLVLTASLAMLTLHFKEILLDNHKDKLNQVAQITSKVLRDDIKVHASNHLDFDILAKDIGNSSKVRVTIINQDGEVVGDSHVTTHEISNMDNHGGRTEIISAVKKGTGQSTRYSSTKGYDLMYYALKVNIPIPVDIKSKKNKSR